MGDLVWSIITFSLPSVTRFKREEFEQKAKAMTGQHARKEEGKEKMTGNILYILTLKSFFSVLKHILIGSNAGFSFMDFLDVLINS